MKSKTAIIYARVSTRRQADDGLPIDSQIERCKARAASVNAEVLRVFADEGVSGRIESRPAFQAAIGFCLTERPHYFITWSTSRFARDQADAIAYKRKLAAVGTRVVYCGMEIDRDTNSGFLTEAMLEVMDEYQSRAIATDTRRSMARNAELGYFNGGHPPVGYAPQPAVEDPRRKRLAIVEEEAEIVRRIFTLRLEGLGAGSIAAMLNDEGVELRGKRLEKNRVLSILRSDAVRGYSVFGRRERRSRAVLERSEWTIVRSHEPIIDEGTWAAVQALVDDSRAEPGAGGSPLSQWLFTGLARCGRCGGSLQIETAKGRSRRYSYYNCRNAQRYGTCPGRRIRADQFDAWLLDEIATVVFSRQNLVRVLNDMREACEVWSAEQEREIRAALAKVKKLESKQRNIVSTIEEHGPGAPRVDLLLRQHARNEDEIESLQVRVAALRAQPPPVLTVDEEGLDELGDLLYHAMTTTENPKRTRAALAGFVQRVILEDERVQVVYWPEVVIGSMSGNRGLLSPVPSKHVWLPVRPVLGTATFSRRLPARWRRAA